MIKFQACWICSNIAHLSCSTNNSQHINFKYFFNLYLLLDKDRCFVVALEIVFWPRYVCSKIFESLQGYFVEIIKCKASTKDTLLKSSRHDEKTNFHCQVPFPMSLNGKICSPPNLCSNWHPSPMIHKTFKNKIRTLIR